MIPAIVLAAGRSSRMGRPKALLTIGPAGETFLQRILRVLDEAGVNETIVVVGPESPLVAGPGTAQAQAMPPLPTRVRPVVNPDPGRGQLSSVLEGLRLADRPGVTGVMVTLVDVPLVSAATIRALLAAHEARHARITRPVRGGRHGHPVIVDRSLFDDLRGADPSLGMKAVIHAHESSVVDVEVDDDGPFLDVDTPLDYERLQRLH
jgi:molybdenum cofactor cytidylyltransferase